jgi:hypothetical protein
VAGVNQFTIKTISFKEGNIIIMNSKKAHAIYSFNENYVLGGFYISNPLNYYKI